MKLLFKQKSLLFLTAFFAVLGANLSPIQVHASVNDFKFSNFHGDYFLSRDDEKRSTLKVVETFTADFPNFKQNKGVTRAIPLVYDGHSVSVQVESLSRNNQTEPIYKQYRENNNLVIATGTEDYLLGPQTYVLNYTLRDVTKDFGDHQEFYWNTIGSTSSQVFEKVSATIHLDDAIETSFTKQSECYQGSQGSNQKCKIDKMGKTINFSSTSSLRYGDLTMVLAFTKDTFSAYQKSTLEIAQIGFFVLQSTICLISLIWAIISYKKRKKNIYKKGSVPPEYIPPKNVSLIFSSGIINAPLKTIPAQIIDLAVKRKLLIKEIAKPKLFDRKAKEYSLELSDTSELLPDELSFLKILFPELTPGSTYKITSKSQASLGIKLSHLVDHIHESATNRGYRIKGKSNHKPAILLLIFFVPSLILFLVSEFNPPLMNIAIADAPLPIVVSIFLLIVIFSLGVAQRPFSKKGAQLNDYLQGLKLYIQAAESERLKIAQSAQAARRIKKAGSGDIVHLYERLLPYAILFGLEKSWAKELALHYDAQNSTPDWYYGSSSFNTLIFISSLNSFSRAISTSFSSPNNSSSSGLGGGGFSGGGGGGGGFGGR